jgi:serine/threonine protein kinase
VISPLVRADGHALDAHDVEPTVEWDPHGTRGHGRPDRVALGRPVTADSIIARRFRISRLLGTGGMGAVWLAEDDVLRRPVALKQLTNEQREEGSSALREARAAARISHHGVVRVHDVLLDEDGHWIVMEALPGVPLSTIIRERGRLPVDEVTTIALHLVSALEAIHAADLVHRDVKPSNVQICGDDRVVLTDFGLSTPHGIVGGLRSGAVTGSLPYLAPETILDGHVGPPSDLYALGVTLFTAVEGHPPFTNDAPLSLLDSLLSNETAPTRHAGCLDVVIQGLLQRDPARRMNTATARSLLLSIASADVTGVATSAPN